MSASRLSSLTDRTVAVLHACCRASLSAGSFRTRPSRITALLTLALCSTVGARAASIATLTSPVGGSVLPGSSATFTWSTVTGAITYQLWVGTNGAGSGNLGVYSEPPTSAAFISVTATGLPTNGSTVYARLFADVNGNWTVDDVTYKAANAALPAVNTLSCGSSTVTGGATDACAVALSSAAPSGGAKVSLASSSTAIAVPASVTVPAGSTSASFNATTSAVSTAQSGTLTATSGNVSKSLTLSLKPVTPTLSALSCSATSLTGAAVDGCAVGLSARAPSGGTKVTLVSSDTAITVPASVTVPAGNTSASFNATVSAVSTAQTGTLTAVSGGVSKTLTLTLKAALPAVSFSAGSLSFGNVSLNTPTTQSVTLTSSGTAPLTIGSVAVSGTGFTASGIATPLTLAPGQTAVLAVQFDPTTAGAASGKVTISTNASSGATQAIALSGTGTSTTPILVSPAPGSMLPGSSATFTWTTVSGAVTYQLWLGTNGAGSGNIAVYSAAPSSAGTISVSATGLPINGGTVYARLFTDVNGNWIDSDYTYTAASAAPALNSIACTSGAITGAGNDVCSVSLTVPASSGGFAVTLASSSSFLSVPASVTVAAGASSASFTASASAVSTAQAATISASAAGVSKAVTLQLNPATAALSLSTTSVSFGTVQLNTPSTQSVTLTSSGTASLTISSVTLTGIGFSASGISTPLSLAPGQSATLNVQFDPTTASSFTGNLTVASNASSGSSQAIALSGTGSSTTYGVNLSWEPPTGSGDPIAGYNIYRSAAGSSSYQLLNSSVNTSTGFSDTTVQCAQDYTYIVTSVDPSGVESLPSNSIQISIP